MSKTLLTDIIDMNDPNNQSEGKNYHNIPFANIPEYNNTQYTPNTTTELIVEPPIYSNQPQMQPQIQPQIQPQMQMQSQISPHHFNHEPTYQTTPISAIKHIHNPYTGTHVQKKNNHTESLKDDNVRELTDKYEELCQICKKVNDNNNMVHAIYITIIATMSIILLLLVKKIMNN